MSDRYQQLVNTPIGKIVSKQVGLPSPVKLDRYERGQPVISGPVLLGAAPGARLAGAVAKVLAAIDAEVHTALDDDVRTAAADAGLSAQVFNPDTASEDQRFKALVFDASGIADSSQLHEAYAFFHPTIRRVRTSGRVIVLGTPPDDATSPRQATAQQRSRGVRALDRQGGPQGRDRPAGLRRPEGRGPDRVDPALLPLAEVGLRVAARSCASGPAC